MKSSLLPNNQNGLIPVDHLLDLCPDFLDPLRKRKGGVVRHSTGLQQPVSGILRAYGHLNCFADELPAIES
jgi:hypothetical protein